VTYNFDPDRWYADERLRLEMRQRSGQMTAEEAQAALEEIERRYDAMLDRLNGTFPVASPGATKPPAR
jgi:hypothetical protein